jgi:hypothetical protein
MPLLNTLAAPIVVYLLAAIGFGAFLFFVGFLLGQLAHHLDR